MTATAFKVSKLSMRLSKDGFVSYNCEIRKGRKTYAYVDQEGIGGSEHIYGHESKHTLQEVEDWIWENCKPMFLQYQTQVFLIQNNLQSVENNDPKLLEFLKPLEKAWMNKEQDKVTCDHLVGWWATTTAENKYYK
tara:strand:- start:551 stop:958 length:408 start_codon:yes stop_codon:yes gene_type:complete